MLDLKQIKTLLQIAGITHLKIDFDEKQKVVNADYVFKRIRGTKRITYQEIIDSLTIGSPEAGTCPVLDEHN